ncbi:endonuclease-reverse transcriptase [Elysia marginata]|uniref:Endonuclease-reverse transcriptase n=1 Tax=Elysia marginata TaxID=1093978 RepID=A0AAV4JW11_9GAST|nr:endonuclease-reverse transcriptase [Elysia marginata]
MRPEELENKAKEIFTEASKHLKTKQQKKQKWLSDEALQKMQERRIAKSKGQHHEDYKKKAREVKQIIRPDKKKYIEDKCEQIENNFSKNRSRDAYNIIKSLTKTFQPKSVVIKDENGNALTESRQILDRWKREFAILEARLEGKRRKGRPTRRWTEDIKEWLQISPTEAGREAQKREVFRRRVREATSTQTCQNE